MKCAVVTGAARGLGRELALTLANSGYSVIAQYRHSLSEMRELQKLAPEGSILPIHGDFSLRSGVSDFIKALPKELQHVDVLVNNVGNFLEKSAQDTSIEELEEIYQTNFFAAFQLTNFLLPQIKQAKGHIINIGYSGLTSKAKHSFACAYFLTKQSLLTWSKTLAYEMIPHSVRVNMLSPGHLENTVVKVNNPSSLLFSRTGTLKEFAEIFLFLISEKSNYVTGQNLEVAGGAQL
ncbi:MAG: SDR family oxidoreductase [Chlamydiales bacterium]|nr:SDR family oxidoreductase [Chlamydiales bacterium]